MRGRPIPLSPFRRYVCEVLAAGSAVPTVPVQRQMCLGAVSRARAAHPARPPWPAIFAKAYGAVSARVPELRRAYIKFPWPRLFEYPLSAAAVSVEREYEGEKVVFHGVIKRPEKKPLTEVARDVRLLQQAPLESCREFARALRLGRLPLPLRRLGVWVGLNVPRQRVNNTGTFLVSVYSALGAESLHPIAPVTSLNYGIIGADGTVTVRIIYDHRVMDGPTVARALEQLEAELNGSILAELQAGAEAPPQAA
jgi:hypothetical protein